MNKVDIMRLKELSPEKRAILKPLEDDANVPVLEMSTLTDFGVMEVKMAACERLLAFRVDQKIKNKKVYY
jgi:nucleolar GTP-binding protein